MSRRKYTYQVVSGSAVFGAPRASIRSASVAAERQQARGEYPWDLELERIYETASGGRMYWRMRGKKWVPWTVSADADSRKPALFWPALTGSAGRRGE